MSPPDETQRTIGGLAGKAVGRAAKDVLRQAGGSGELTREGRLQQAQSETALEAREASRIAREREAGGAVQEHETGVRTERDPEESIDAGDAARRLPARYLKGGPDTVREASSWDCRTSSSR